MQIRRHIEALRTDGALLAAAAARTGWDTPIPTCPEWRMRDLVQHIGDVHRWAATHVAERRLEPIKDVAEIAGPLPDDHGLLDWFREGHDRLLTTLETADPDVRCWSFLPAPSPLAFWARRQAHETSIHRVDAESAGDRITPFPPEFARDGIDEMLFGFLGRGSKQPAADPPLSLHLHATDTQGEWLARIGPDGPETSAQHDEADCEVRGTASDLFLLVWNRRSAEGLNVIGDRSVLNLWRDQVQIQWGRPR